MDTSRVSRQGGATYDVIRSRDPIHVTVDAFSNDVSQATTGNAEVKVTSSAIHQSTAADFSQHANSAYV